MVASSGTPLGVKLTKETFSPATLKPMGELTMHGRLLLTIFWSAALFGQAKEGSSCVLDSAKDGDLIKVRGEVFLTGHDTFIRPVDCPDSPTNRAIVVWADDPSLGTDKASVRRDAQFSEFNRFVNAAFPLPPNAVGVGQPRYQVHADFEGRLQVAKAAGLKRDPEGKKVIGIEGLGHPMPFTRFRLLASGVSKVDSKEQQRIAEQTPEPAKRSP